MNRRELSKLPIALREDVQDLFSIMRNLVKENSEYVRLTYDENHKLEIEHNDFDTDYFFKISEPEYSITVKQTYFNIDRKPASKIKTEPVTQRILFNKGKKDIETRFNMWLSLLKRFESISEHPAINILKTYKDRVFNNFEFLEDENDNEPLNEDKQKEFSKLLGFIVLVLEQEVPNEEELINEFIELNKEIPKLTLSQIKERFAWVCAKMKYKGIDITNHIIKTARDAGIGHIFIEGIKCLFN